MLASSLAPWRSATSAKKIVGQLDHQRVWVDPGTSMTKSQCHLDLPPRSSACCDDESCRRATRNSRHAVNQDRLGLGPRCAEVDQQRDVRACRCGVALHGFGHVVESEPQMRFRAWPIWGRHCHASSMMETTLPGLIERPSSSHVQYEQTRIRPATLGSLSANRLRLLEADDPSIGAR